MYKKKKKKKKKFPGEAPPDPPRLQYTIHVQFGGLPPMEYAKSYFAPSNEILNAALILYNNVNFTQLLDSEYLPNSDGKLNGSL